MKVYNTLSRRKEEFTPVTPGKVGFYICGPTVYNDIHIGNARTFLSFDVIRRYLEYSGYEVTYVQNITDVDDKIINRAGEEGRDSAEVAEEYTNAYLEVMKAVGVKEPSVCPKATEEITPMITLIERLIAEGHAYEINGDVYFSVRSFDSYGKLSGRNIDDLVAGARVDVNELKRDPLDFALWKAAKPGEPFWPSPWGEGRPGWHIECSAMSERYLGTPFDIHAGGEDLVFPHHENERAQSEACASGGFANYWLHGGMLTIDKEKMSKSEGNFLLLKDVLEHVRPEALRLLMLQSHYRSPFDYSPERLEEATAALERIEGALRNIQWVLDDFEAAGVETARSVEQGDGVSVPIWPKGQIGTLTPSPCSTVTPSLSPAPTCPAKQAHTRFREYMDDDFNTAGAIAVVFELVSEANQLLAKGIDEAADAGNLQMLACTIVELLAVLGIDLTKDAGTESLVSGSDEQVLLALANELAAYEGASIEEALGALLAARTEAREAKDWPRADAVRDNLAQLGLSIEDTPQGPRITHA